MDDEYVRTEEITRENIPHLARLTRWTEGELYAKLSQAKAMNKKAVILMDDPKKWLK